MTTSITRPLTSAGTGERPGDPARRTGKGGPAACRPARRRLRRDALWAWAMIGPLSLGLGLFYLWPIVRTAYLSFTSSTVFGDVSWAGLANYTELFSDPAFGSSLLHTVLYTAMVVGLGIPLAIVVANLLNTKGLRGVGVYRVIYFIPVVTMPVAVAMIWRYLYNGDYGVINYVLSIFGVDGPRWISDGQYALASTALVAIWMGLGYNVVILLAGLQSIPDSLYEAAALDGAGPVRVFFRITMPLLSPTIFFVTVLAMISSLQVFDLIWVMIGSDSPALGSTKSIVYLFYQQAFIENHPGYASAIAIVLFAIIGAVTWVQFKIQKRWVHYVDE